MSLILVFPFCAKDGALAIQNLEWIAELDPSLPYHCLLSHDDSTPAPMIERMTQLANATFQKVTVAWYPTPEKKYWPAAPNWAFQNAARYIAHFFPQDSWLFLEADAVPVRSGWLQELEAEHIRGGKPITGHIVSGLGHPNGVAIYPSMVSAYSQQAMTVEETAWDVVIGATVDKEFIHRANALIQHCWNMHEETGEATNGHGYSPTFKSLDDIIRKLNLESAIYHRCKDGSLIHWLREFKKAPHKAMVPNHTSNEHETLLSESVPVHSDAETTRTENPNLQAQAFTGKCEIFIVTYGLPTKRASGLVVSDFDWLTWCLRCIRKHCTGFSGITLAIPSRDAKLLQPIANEHAQSNSGIPLHIKMMHEKPGKGMLTHMAAMASAEEFVPKDTTHVIHLDADCMFRTPSTPNDYFENGKPVYLIRTWDSLVDGKGVVSDCAQWRGPTEAQLGFKTDWYTMCRLGSVFPLNYYPAYRKHVEAVQGKPFMDFMLSGRNEFPQDRMDWTAMGAFARHAMESDFAWIDIGNNAAPKDRFMVYWSHGGISPEIQKEIESFLS